MGCVRKNDRPWLLTIKSITKFTKLRGIENFLESADDRREEEELNEKLSLYLLSGYAPAIPLQLEKSVLRAKRETIY